jgi:hypothetical protein
MLEKVLVPIAVWLDGAGECQISLAIINIVPVGLCIMMKLIIDHHN